MNTKTKTNKKNIKNINITMNKLTEEEILDRKMRKDNSKHCRLYRLRHPYADIKQRFSAEYIEREKVRIKKKNEKKKDFTIFKRNMPNFIE